MYQIHLPLLYPRLCGAEQPGFGPGPYHPGKLAGIQFLRSYHFSNDNAVLVCKEHGQLVAHAASSCIFVHYERACGDTLHAHSRTIYHVCDCMLGPLQLITD